MTGRFIDNIRFSWKSPPQFDEDLFYLDTDYGKVRISDTKGNKPIIINAPDGPNVIEHQANLIRALTKNYRVICFEFPGLGFSYPNKNYDYSIRSGSNLLHQIMNNLKIEKASLLFSCSNGYYAIQSAIQNPERFTHIFLSQSPSIKGLLKWTDKSIPKWIKTPIIGQVANALYAEKLSKTWYKYALPKNHASQHDFTLTSHSALKKGGCFCLSSLVQGLKKDSKTLLKLSNVPTTLVWGSSDFTHRKTQKESIRTHIKECEIVEFKNCGHFPELENTESYVKLINERVNK